MSTKNLAVTLTVLALPLAALATPTGLNNIPTADTIPHRMLAIQAFSSYGGPNQFGANGPGRPSHWLGFKTGWKFESFQSVNLEWGLDSPILPGRTGSLLFQTKVGGQPWEKGAFAVGIANVALTDYDRWSDPFTYAMVAHDFGLARLHGGFGFQTDGNTVLLGIDRTWKVFDRNFNLNADLVQTRNQNGWLPSVGAKYDLHKHVVLETWVNFPDRGTVSVIPKINFVLSF